ncbi:MAG: beta-propeller domain-containing protein [Candidatus Saccharibacteria bacterium]
MNTHFNLFGLKYKGLNKITAIISIILMLAFSINAALAAAPITGKANGDGVSYQLVGDKITLNWGQKATGGYSISIVSMTRKGSTLTVYYRLKSPGAGDFVTQAITYPKVTAQVPKGTTAIKKVVLVNKASAPSQNNPPKNTKAEKITSLPSVGSYNNLIKLMTDAGWTGRRMYGDLLMSKSMNGAVPAPTAVAKEAATDQSAGAGADYSTTNVQVQGVDEADVVKTDGQYIYQVNKYRVLIIKATPPSKMEIMASADFTNQNFYPQEIYVDSNRLVVIGASNGPVVKEMLPPSFKAAPGLICPPRPINETSKAVIYDITNKREIKKIRAVEVEGNYLTSRKIGDNLYMLAQKWLPYYSAEDKTDLRPYYRDTVEKEAFQPIEYSSIKYFPWMVSANYLVVAGIDLQSQTEAHITTYLGSGENVYCSSKNLYVAVNDYNPGPVKPMMGKIIADDYYQEATTRVFKFSLNGRTVTFTKNGQVPGTPLNQFSMDENGAYFRIATTTGQVWRSDEHTSRNNVYVLDSNMDTVGKLEGIAPGEKIYSTRFMGNRLYMVTFKKTDPFFVIDMKNPKAPKVLGALKIPGYSDYLHPYDENHVIGFGKDTVESKQGDFAWYQGMKIAVFDVTNVSKPVEMFKTAIGDRGTDSELLRNHKALLFSKERNLLALPVTVMEIQDKKDAPRAGDMPQYGSFSFQGAYVYSLDLKNGFRLKGRITHLTEDDYLKAGSYWNDVDKNVERIIYIGDTLYTLSKSKIKANGMDNLKQIGELSLGS